MGHSIGLLLSCVFIDLGLSQRFTVKLDGLTRVGIFRGLMLNLMGLKNLGPFKGLRNLGSSEVCLVNLMGLRVTSFNVVTLCISFGEQR